MSTATGCNQWLLIHPCFMGYLAGTHMKDREGPSKRQQKSTEIKPPEPSAPAPNPVPEGPASEPEQQEMEPAVIDIRSIRRGEIYLSEHVTGALKISKPTLEMWITEGLRFSRRGTRRRFFLGDHLIDFMFDPT